MQLREAFQKSVTNITLFSELPNSKDNHLITVSFWFCWFIIQVITGGHDTSPSSTSRTSTAGTTSCGWTTPTVNCNDILQLMRRTLEPNEEAMSRSYIIEKWESARNMYVDRLQFLLLNVALNFVGFNKNVKVSSSRFYSWLLAVFHAVL